MSKIPGFSDGSAAESILALNLSLWLVIGCALCNHGSLNGGQLDDRVLIRSSERHCYIRDLGAKQSRLSKADPPEANSSFPVRWFVDSRDDTSYLLLHSHKRITMSSWRNT
jgi:hypothetical protein